MNLSIRSQNASNLTAGGSKTKVSQLLEQKDARSFETCIFFLVFLSEHVARRRQSGLVLEQAQEVQPIPVQSRPVQPSPALPCTSSHPVA